MTLVLGRPMGRFLSRSWSDRASLWCMRHRCRVVTRRTSRRGERAAAAGRGQPTPGTRSCGHVSGRPLAGQRRRPVAHQPARERPARPDDHDVAPSRESTRHDAVRAAGRHRVAGPSAGSSAGVCAYGFHPTHGAVQPHAAPAEPGQEERPGGSLRQKPGPAVSDSKRPGELEIRARKQRFDLRSAGLNPQRISLFAGHS